MHFDESQLEESKKIIHDEIGSSDSEENNEEEKKEESAADGDEEESEDEESSDGEVDLEALAAEREAKKAKKLLPPKKAKAVRQKIQPAAEEEGDLVVNMDYVKKKARRQYKNK